MNYYLIAGERSGDLHGANLIKGIRSRDPQARFRGWGGDLMKEEGMELVTHYREAAFMGFLEVVRNLGTILRMLNRCRRDVEAWRPDALILIDYPGFNLRMARFARKAGIRVFYYISPKVWAWNQDRALKIRRDVDRMFVIFPFEVEFYRKYDYEVEYVGNPLMDAIASFRPDPGFRAAHGLEGERVIALLPGSRLQEISKILDDMLRVIPFFPDHRFVVAGVKDLPASLYHAALRHPRVQVVDEAAYDLLSVSEAALVTSGTATLETALLDVPEVVCYKTSNFSYQLAKRLVRVPYISLVNLISGKEVVRELIQGALTTDNLVRELKSIVEGGAGRAAQLSEYARLRDLVGAPGASERTGARIVGLLSSP